MSITSMSITSKTAGLKLLALSAFALGGLAACAPQTPNPHSPAYSRVTMTDGQGADGTVRKGYDRAGRRQAALLPDACVTPDVAPDPLYLPSGCANAINLQQMVESERDLERGQEPGPSMAAPTARAARAYINGEGQRERRKTVENDDPANDSYTGGAFQTGTSAGR